MKMNLLILVLLKLIINCKEEGYITTVDLVGVAQTATATVGVSSGCVAEIFLNNDGSGFTSAPTITFSDAPEGGHNASAVAITTES